MPRHADPLLPDTVRHSATRVAVAGLIALAVAMGIGRFAFTPLLPLMMRDGLIDAAEGSLLAAANYAGYLIGALTAARMPLGPLGLVRIGLPAIALLTALAAWWPGPAAWLAWRFGAGVASAWVLVGTSSWCLSELARLGRSSAGGWVFGGVGLGIALAGAMSWAFAGAGSAALWQLLGATAIVLAAIVLGSARGPSRRPGPPPQPARGTVAHAGDVQASAGTTGWVICYGSFGFGYILPATYLPALARVLVDDPRVFGLAWPLFGLAAAASTLLAGRALAAGRHHRIWAACHGLMAIGTLLPVASGSGAAIAASALLVGGTFMVATMAGLQLARTLRPQDPTGLIGRMTAAFALGQIAGPMAAFALAPVRVAGLSGIDLGLILATLLLAASGLWLARSAPAATPVREAPAD